jgi:hypothetical protein
MRKTEYRSLVSLLVIGLSVGWLMGLSVSPVVQTVVGVVITSAAAIVGALAGVSMKTATSDASDQATEEDSARRLNAASAARSYVAGSKTLAINPSPLALLLFGMILGSLVGVCARTNGWLGPNPDRIASRWSDTDLTKQEIKRRLFDQVYPSPSTPTHSKKESSEAGELPINKPFTGGLFAASTDRCELLLGRAGDELRSRLLLISSDREKTIIETCKLDEVCLEAIREVVCAGSK